MPKTFDLTTFDPHISEHRDLLRESLAEHSDPAIAVLLDSVDNLAQQVPQVWAEGYGLGVIDERRSAAHAEDEGVLLAPARVNPYYRIPESEKGQP